jgi:hypothetical protein
VIAIMSGLPGRSWAPMDRFRGVVWSPARRRPDARGGNGWLAKPSFFGVISLMTGAAATGVNRTTILRAIKAGKVSAERDAQGAWTIQPSELHRVWPTLPQLPAVSEPVQTHAPEAEAALLRTLVEEMRATIADLRRREDDLKADRDHWRQACSATQRLLPKPMPEDAQPVHWAKRAWRWSRG